MRLNRLDLIRYGRFKDAEIVLPKHGNGAADVTVIFGPNEAGKSTAFHGFMDLLFGFKGGAHPYAFKFERSDLLVGAELDLPGRGAVILRRNGKRSRSLLDAQDRPLEEAILGGALHGLDRDAYTERFSLNDESLRRGGERIAGAQGDLGQLLHAGVSGLTGIAATLDELSARADGFHKKHGRATWLKTGKDRLTEIGRELRADRLTIERERSLRRDRDRATAAFEEAAAALRQAHQRQAAAKAAQVWYGRSDELTRIDEALTAFPSGPDLPLNTSERVAGLVEKIANLEARLAEAAEDILRLDTAISENAADPLAEPLAAELARLEQLTIDGAPLMGRATTAQADLARRFDEIREQDRLIRDVLTKLSVSEEALSVLVLTPDALEDLNRATQDVLTARAAAKAAQDRLDTARKQMGEAPQEPQDLSALRAAHDAWQTVADLTSHETATDQAAARLTDAVAGLPATWKGLIEAGLPARETVDDVAREYLTLTAQLTSAENERESHAAELAEARAEREAQEAAPDTVDIASTQQARRTRDLTWKGHRAEMTDRSADAFEEAMYADDSARAHYQTGTEARQRLQAARSRERTAQARLDTAKARLDDIADRHGSLSERIASISRAIGLPEDSAASALAARHQTLTTAAAAAADLANAQAALKSRQARKAAALTALSEAAQQVGLDTDIANLPSHALKSLTLEDSHRQAWTKWQKAQETVAELDTEARQAGSERDEAERSLDSLTATLPLTDRSPAGLRSALPHLRALQQLHADRQKLSTRIEALERAISAMKDGAKRLCRILGTSEDEALTDPLRVIDDARARATAARRADEKRIEATERREAAISARDRAEANRNEAQSELNDCFSGQGASDLAPSDRVAQLVERDRQRAARATADKERKSARDSVDPELFIDELARLPDAVRATELEIEQKDAQDNRDAARDAQREAERIYKEAFDAADRSDLATEQATILEELRDGAHRAAVARLGVLAARGALRRLAAERRSSMLQDVEEAFVSMTAPAWTGVDVWSQDEGEKLVGIQPGGGSVPVEQMSTGTMGQLYFALRLAGYRAFARDPGPLPMVLDDIMETFDDTRARAALQLCAEIGKGGQAILFTHHAHLVELARDTIPGVGVVDMPA
ncbi:AAA family ATPase [Flavimaricola marinus]|uniref:YhaN AAA domain-containing protein n=1 Tax=Flavimaricola marinus TaxID=1819565 RepID=A0A238LJ46_9RHOB|nr:AAA family ATPase [Flavimaricola marinus]SMY09425.1 hypothetical protein LOM8899_03592 [Flavimaricola marinus]